MNYRLTNLLMFAAGAAVGSVVTWKLLKTKYEQIAQEEIDSVKETFSRNRELIIDEELEAKLSEHIDMEKLREDRKDYATRIAEEEYKEEEEIQEMGVPYVISPDEFGEMGEDYDTFSLTLYADGYLVNEDDEVIDDPDYVVGPEALNSFGQYEEDSVFVRDDENMCDYEILKDYRKYGEVNPDYLED